MKYSVFHDFGDDGYYVVNNRSNEYATEIKVYESDSLHDCFEWAFANAKRLYSDLHNENVWRVHRDNFSENYYMCLDKGDGTLDDVCFRGSEEECNNFLSKHFIAEDNFESEDSVFPCDYE